MINNEMFLNDTILNIFKSTDVETLLTNSLKCLKRYIPIDMIDLSYYLEEEHSILRLCTVEENRTYKDLYIKLPDSIKPEDFKRGFPNDCVYNYNERVAQTENKTNFICPTEGNSCIVLQCRNAGHVIGNLAIKVYKENVYTDEHKDLMRFLATPYTMALCTAITAREMRNSNYSSVKNSISQDSALTNFAMSVEPDMNKLLTQAKEVAEFSSAVLLTGETGVGKEVFANFIHSNSDRKHEAFIKINCGAIPETLIDNELFGHEKGAFTGADSSRKGRFELAHNGTLFLDEVGELPLNSQTKLLRALQFGEIERLGGGKAIKVNVRVISATNKNLPKMVKDGTFREDLFWRLNVFPIEIPPLRERKGDIPILLRHITEKICRKFGIKNIPEIDGSVMEKLISYQWPGNVREMENIVEREIIMNHATEMKFEHINTGMQFSSQPEQIITESNIALDHVMKAYILKTLHQTNWRISGKNGAAYILGIHPNTLRHRMKKLGIF
ncbi:MAG: sigma 54-interacting transcriptional regulator [Geovibrio sp.]|nr:sigma 54-interacting transcriptional regulator [Geovibrio sp.]